jgi:glycosyltransferase involved in cell wall biosynthesis
LLVLASNRAGSSEAFKDQESGYSLDPYKPSSWSVLLEGFYTKPEKFIQVRKYAFLRAHEQFSAKVNCQKLKSLFDQTFA